MLHKKTRQENTDRCFSLLVFCIMETKGGQWEHHLVMFRALVCSSSVLNERHVGLGIAASNTTPKMHSCPYGKASTCDYSRLVVWSIKHEQILKMATSH